jgi:hypothetical protein
MASSSPSQGVVQSFTIALIVFVMLTLVLAVTTYLFFKKADENLKLLEAKQKEASEENSKRLEAVNQRLELVKDVLGFPEDMDNAQILDRKKAAVDDAFGKYLEQPTYARLTDWLASSIQTKHKEMSQLEADKVRVIADRKKAIDDKDKELEQLRADKKKAQEDIDELRQKSEDYEKEATAEKQKYIDARDAAEEQAKRYKLLGEEIAKAAPLLSSERRKNWPADGGEGGQAGAEGVDDRRVTLMMDELRDRERQIFRLNQVVAQLRATDPSIQNVVLAATPKDDRVDAFDGRVLTVNERDRTVLVSVPRVSGIRAGLMFDVFPPDDPQPQLGSRKAVVEVVAVESDSLVRARVRKDSTQNPILPGDAVATSLWSADSPLEVVIVGGVQFGNDATGDAERLKRLVERIGGEVSAGVSPTTTMVVDAGIPKAKGLENIAAGLRKPLTDKEKDFRLKQMAEARQNGIKVVTLDAFLEMMGLQMDAIGSTRLPVPVDRRAAPTPQQNLAN